MTCDEAQVMQNVVAALSEDIGSGDVTAALLPKSLKVEAQILSREPLLVCGQPWVNAVFKEVDPAIEIQWLATEGSWCAEPRTLCLITGNARSILTAERTALNFLQTLSATATQTYHYAQKLIGTSTRLLDTRKTIPGLRLAQKYAVLCGGGVNHRMGLYDAYLIKENHIKASGSLTAAISLAREKIDRFFIEVEVENLDQLQEALKAGPDRILLDNFNLEDLAKAVALNQPKICELEASGGITSDNLVAVANTGVDYISVGVITKSIKAIDLSLLIREIHEP